MRIGIGISMAAAASQYDAEDLSRGAFRLNFVGINEPTFRLNFLTETYQRWADDPGYPYGTYGVFQRKN